ncbi:Hsp70 family protein [Spirochaeta isovalerica]|uniref:Molecular chaperone DnaK n=1 Tax=Spirochaeta isovalerica TaxID=150 RepID=A0A841RD93_9SPIO|nr:Hsp70 family protein [Spirochaeta isovalerica]MBB6481933.1 molecular chaperone DnaK [Spirochaeta isovalerica]
MKHIIGIDLGTTNSSAAFYDKRELTIIPNSRGRRITPSAVAIDPSGEILVGESARNQALINRSATVLNVKRRMGSDHIYTINGKGYSPQEISSFILKSLKKDCENYLGEEVSEAVITVPAYFNERQRKATIEAGRLAGLKVRKIINEPTSSALIFADRKKEDRTLLVYDLGGGTFDVSLLRKEGNRFIVIASNGESRLGGVDFDNLLYKKVAAYFSAKAGISVNDDSLLVQHLRNRVEQAKIELSTRESATISLPFISTGKGPVHLTYRITRDEFNRMIRPLAERTMNLLDKTLRESRISRNRIDNLVLSGGSSRIPLIRELLQSRFGFTLEKQVNPEESVALGAAFQGYLLEKGEREIEIQDVTSHSLGVEIDDGTFIPIIRKNSPLPSIQFKTFTTVADNQRSVEIKILEGENRQAALNSPYGRFLLSGIRQGRRGDARIKVAFKVDTDGLLHVKAKDMDTGIRQNIIFTSSVMDSGSRTEDEERIILEKRVHSLINRVQGLNRMSPLSYDFNFQCEIREVLYSAEQSLKERDYEGLWEAKTALESITAELNAILDGEVQAV